ncbi:molybdopterin-guanine dinucleotide biosynthesis protein B [Paucisalibacillus sp. EB02]|uniref:molybdopterin-guanine dinucleotide biosynthesis protein B n=1 Tax=Paucisalibacillus sp. EB02 TaxID=1347087 RepID=UPI0006946FB1|nr:molybdopterin-guanine dinucleotide biosynthesis protein B [Paucisalibacillus sp. EB02]
MKILQVVGFKNSGKTTVSIEIIRYFTSKGIKVGSLKNHGHGGTPIGIDRTDSDQHQKAGSTIAGVVGENIFQLSHIKKWEVADMLAIYQHLNMELLLLEGFKELTYPKLVLLQNQDDLSMLTSLKNIIGVIKSSDIHIEDNDRPVFDRENTRSICEWLYQHHYLLGGVR